VAQIAGRLVGAAEQQRRDVVGEDPVALLGHTHVAGAHAGLDVDHRDLRAGGRERAGERRVGVAVDERGVRLDLVDQRLERREHPRRLRRVAAAGDVQLDVRSGEAELLEEDARKRVVVVLAGVDEDLLVAGAQRSGDRGGLHELRPVADDGQDSHGSIIACGGP